MVAVADWLCYPYGEPARLWYGVTGIDVSHHQGRIDWPLVAGSGVSFAYLKATEGGDFVDPSFASNWAAARATGLAVGAYHFYRRCKGGQAQVDGFLRHLPNEANQLPPVIDVEDMDPCPAGDLLDPAAEIALFVAMVQARTGCRPLLYVTHAFDAAYLQGKFADDRFWVRSILFPPWFRQQNWVFWQYHNAGRRAGIKGPVDLNVFRASPADLAALVRDAGCFRAGP